MFKNKRKHRELNLEVIMDWETMDVWQFWETTYLEGGCSGTRVPAIHFAIITRLKIPLSQL